MSDFQSLALAKPLTRLLEEENFSTPTPIQKLAIPELIEGHDLMGIAQTGTGKTAAFVLPMLHRLINEKEKARSKHARFLILAPTRELAAQIMANIKLLGKHVRLRSLLVVGGKKIGPQRASMRNGVDLLVATPGRLMDLMRENSVFLDETRAIVLDEADQMLDMGFIRDVRFIMKALPDHCQKIMFSATMHKQVGKLADEMLNEPKYVEIPSKSIAVERIDQTVLFIQQNAKMGRLTEILSEDSEGKVIVFVRTKHGADRIVRKLSDKNIRADALHGNKSQNARQRTLENFKQGKNKVLIATDIAARGIHVDGITLVINYDLPRESEAYVHRIGRTARAGAEGRAVSFCDKEEMQLLRGVEKLIGREIDKQNEPQEGSYQPKNNSSYQPQKNGQNNKSGQKNGKPFRKQGGRPGGGEVQNSSKRKPAKKFNKSGQNTANGEQRNNRRKEQAEFGENKGPSTSRSKAPKQHSPKPGKPGQNKSEQKSKPRNNQRDNQRKSGQSESGQQSRPQNTYGDKPRRVPRRAA